MRLNELRSQDRYGREVQRGCRRRGDGEATFRLQGLKPRSVYEVEDADSGRKVRVAGRKLMEEGIKVSLKSAPESRLIFYRVVR